MSAVEEIQSELRTGIRFLALPGEPGESVKACIRRAATKAGLGFGTVKRIWYGELRCLPRTDISDAIRRAVRDHERRLDAEWETLKARHWALAHHSSDEEFYSVRVDEACPPTDELD